MLRILPLVFLLGCGSAAAPAVSPTPTPTPTPTPMPTPTPEPPPAVIADLHVDTVTMMLRQDAGWTAPSLEASLRKMRSGGVNVAVEALWIERGQEDPFGRAVEKLKRVRSSVLQSQKQAAIVSSPEQLDAVLKEGRLAVVLALEGGTALVEGEASLVELRKLGVSMMGLTWSESSPYADSSAEPRSPGGLTELGRMAVDWCNDRGVMIDVSHMSDQATKETVARSRAPVLASHSNPRAWCDVPRNLPDDLLEGIAAKGGLVGAMFHGPFVQARGEVTRGHVVAMIRSMVRQLGAEHVGIGSDWDGIIKAPVGLEGADRLPVLRKELVEAGLSDEEVALVSGGSFRRLWGAVWALREGVGEGTGTGP